MLIPEDDINNKSININKGPRGIPNISQEKISQVKEAIERPELEFFFIATSGLKEILAQDNHHIFKQLPQKFKLELMQGNGLVMDKKYLMSYLTGNLDYKNTLLLNNCEILVLGEGKPLVERHSDGRSK